MEMTIADLVEELRSQLEWSNEANALGDVECDYNADDTSGWLTMGPARVEWLRDPYGDGQEGWIAVNVAVDGEPFDVDGYSELDEAVKNAAHTTEEWQHYRGGEIRDEIIEWLDSRCEIYDLQGPEDEHDAWTIFWRDVSIQGYFTEDDGTFEWSVSNSETADYLDGGADDDEGMVIDAIEQVTTDPMIEAWVETVAVETAEDDWSVRTSEDQMTVYMHSSIAYGLSRRAYYEPTGYKEGRIELEYRVRGSEWRPFDEYLPEDEDDVRRMAGEAYAWVKAVDA